MPISIEFTHRFLTDTIHDFGEVEISYDNGNYWFDLLSDTLNPQFDIPPTKGNFHIYENTNDTLFDNLIISGNSGGWIHSKFYKILLDNQMAQLSLLNSFLILIVSAEMKVGKLTTYVFQRIIYQAFQNMINQRA